MSCYHSLIRNYSIFLSKYYIVFLVLTPCFVVLCALLSFVPQVGPTLPDFSKPTKGFEPRGTSLMKRIITHQETLDTAIKTESLVCNPNITSSRRRKRSPSQVVQMCNIDVVRYSSAKTVYESGDDLMDARSLKAVCNLEENVLRSTPGFKSRCQWNDENAKCCASYSLGNYIASIRNRTSCQDITSEDVTFMKTLLRNCSLYFSGEQDECENDPQKCPTMCKRYAKELQVVFTYTVGRDYMRTSEILENTMVLSPMYDDLFFLDDVYNTYLKDDFPVQDGVKMVAFDFPELKFDQFNQQLLKDAVFPAIGLFFIAIILMIYTHSVLVMLFTVFSVFSSLVISYFLYHFIFRLTFFPFLNVTTFIFLVGIGADDAFVFTDVWNQAKLSNPGRTMVDWMEYTLNHAALSMLVTSLTTSSAFYANVVSDITAVRLFGIFAGTSIIINYAFMLTWFPAGIILLEKWWKKTIVRETLSEQDVPLGNMSPALLKSCPDNPTPSDAPQENIAGESKEVCQTLDEKGDTNSPEDFAKPANNPHSNCIFKFYGILRTKCSHFMTQLFCRWIPKSLTFFPVWLIALSALGIGMICAVAVSPGLQRPKSSDFQVFSSSHPLEQYDLKYKQQFRADSNKDSSFWVYVFFGIKPEDDGNFLDPYDFGTLTFDTSFDFTTPAAQQWLLELCSHIRNLTFFDKRSNWQCFVDHFKELVDGNSCSVNESGSFPYSAKVVRECSAKLQGRQCTPEYSGLLYDRHRNLKVLRIPFPTNIPSTNEYEIADNLWEDLKRFSDNVLDTAPSGLQNGWAISQLRFYALQSNLGSSTTLSLGVSLAISFVVMLLTSMNWLISVYAILTIVCILATTVGSLVLAGWELNILESIVISVAVGLSVDFTLHYGVAYNTASEHDRIGQVKYALSHIGPAVTLASITTFIAGVFMMFSTVLVYFQLGQFLTLVMAVSWVYATFFFMSLCYVAGPVGNFGQLCSRKCLSCQVAPENIVEDDHL